MHLAPDLINSGSHSPSNWKCEQNVVTLLFTREVCDKSYSDTLEFGLSLKKPCPTLHQADPLCPIARYSGCNSLHSRSSMHGRCWASWKSCGWICVDLWSMESLDSRTRYLQKGLCCRSRLLNHHCRPLGYWSIFLRSWSDHPKLCKENA